MNTKGLKKFLINTEDGIRTFMYRILSDNKEKYTVKNSYGEVFTLYKEDVYKITNV